MNTGPRPSDRFIPWYIVLFFVLQTIFFLWLYHIAASTYTGLVTDKAYEKGLQYNQVIAQASAQAELNWTAKIDPKADGLQLTVQDAQGHPISGAHVRLWLIRPVHDGVDQKLDMPETSPGHYFSHVAVPEKGLWEARIIVKKDSLSYQASRRMEF